MNRGGTEDTKEEWNISEDVLRLSYQPMNLLDHTSRMLEHASRWSLDDWLLIAACCVLGLYAMVIAGR